MTDKKTYLAMAAAVAMLALLPAPGFAQGMAPQGPVEGPLPTTALISVESKHGEQLNTNALKLQINRHEVAINSVTPVSKGPAQVAILIDDGLRASFGNQIGDVKSFIMGLPKGTKVLVGYMQNGGVRSDGFTADRAALIASLRITMAQAGISASPYFCLSEFVKQWPSDEPGARFVLMLTNGVDPYNGSTSILNQDSPYVQKAQEDAQRAGVAVYSIYYADAGFRGARGSFSGQSYLQQVAEATGGEALNMGTIPPPSILPYLEQFSKAMAESYVVSFQADSAKEKKDTLDQLKLTTSQPGVKIHAPENVHPGVSVVQ